MAILWAGGEDIDFPNGGTPSVGNGSYNRTTYSRCYINSTGSWGNVFASGAVTSCWITAMVGWNYNGVGDSFAFGLTKSSSGNMSGIIMGVRNIGQGGVAIYKYDGATTTFLAVSATQYYQGNTAVLHRIDMQVINYGASGTVNIYVDGSLGVTYTGNIAVGSLTSLDAVSLFRGGNASGMSEMIVSDSDTRALVGLATMAPTGAGTTDSWTGAYTDINETTNNDATAIYTNTVSQNEQFNVTDMPAGTFDVAAVMVSARVTGTSGATATRIALGFNSGGSVAVGSAQLTTTAWTTISQIFATNPVTSLAWVLSDMNSLQINLQSS